VETLVQLVAEELDVRPYEAAGGEGWWRSHSACNSLFLKTA
jgi:hypothetical protein